MANPHVRLAALLAQSGAVLVRDHKHRIYNLPNGRTFVSSKTPSDVRSVLNEISHLRHAMAAPAVMR